MAVTIPGISTLGVKLGYAAETTAGQKPAKFKWLERCNNIAGIALSTETIDASALEDYMTRSVAGRQDSGGTWAVTFNLTADTTSQLEGMISAYNTAKQNNLQMWFEVWAPNMTNGFFVVAEPPQLIPMPEFGQNSLLTVEITLTIVEYKGQSTGIEPVENPT